MLDLRRYVPGGRVSSGLLAWYKGQLVWAVAQRKYWRTEDGKVLVSIIGIGGGQEKGETLVDTIRREALEEANAPIAVIGARRTLWVTGEAEIRAVDLTEELAGEPAPVLIWQRKVRLRTDGGAEYELDYINPVYEAIVETRPSPGTETPGLFFMDVELFLSIRCEPASFRELLAKGARYAGEPVPENALITLQGSPLYLATHWSELERGDPTHGLLDPGGRMMPPGESSPLGVMAQGARQPHTGLPSRRSPLP